MDLNLYTIKYFNNTLELFLDKELQLSSEWYMDFGKYGCEILSPKKEVIYKITKQFQFWKWKMVYQIKKNDDTLVELISQNNRRTIYAVIVNEVSYEVKIHYNKKLSVYKDKIKIAEIDESFTDENYRDYIKLLTLDIKDLQACFLLFSCLKIGEVGGNKKPTFTSQKQLEVNEDPWC